MGQPFAYLRKSRLMRGQQVVSPEMQLAAVEEYARLFGDSDLTVLSDMNISGRKGRKHRPGFDDLLSAIESGECSAVYSYSLSRLSRSIRDTMALADLCREHGVPIRLARDMDPDPTTATGRAMLAILSAMAQLEADLASERSLDSAEARRRRGDRMGPPVFADHEVVLNAYRIAGSYTGAAKMLTADGVPTRNGNALWFPSTVRVIVRRAAPELLAATSQRGAKASAPFLFYRLLRCHCGQVLTGVRDKHKHGYVSYRCARGRLKPGHGKAHVAETRILSWAIAEADRLRPPRERVALGESNAEERADIQGRVDRLKVAFLAGLMPEAEMLAEKAGLDERLRQLDLQGRAVAVPKVAWNREPAEVNRTLRALWSSIQLDDDFDPVAAEWLLPESWVTPRA